MGIAITAGYDADFQMYQRNIISKKVFSPIEMSLDLTATSLQKGWTVEYQIEPSGGGTAIVPWTSLGSTQGSSPMVVSIEDVPQGGWYRWLFRTVDANGTVAETMTSTNKWGVGDAFIWTGQSNGDNMFLTTAAPSVNAKTAVFTGTSWGAPVGNGIARFLDQMQDAALADGDDIPVGAINLCLGGSATLEAADYVLVGHWEKTGARPIFDIFQRLGVRALKHHQWVLNPNTNYVTECRGVIYWQGEAEASETVVLFGFVETAQFLKGLLEVFKRFSEWMPNQSNKNTIQVQIGRLQQNSVTESPDGMNTAVAMTREAHFTLTQRLPEANAELCEMMGVQKGADGVHHDASQHEAAGDNIGYACRKAFGIHPDSTLSGYTRLPGTTGPVIESATWTDTNKLLVTIKHDVGSDITVPSTAHECFQLVNAEGKGYFSAISKINSTSFELTIGSASMTNGEVGFAYCNDAMPEIGSLITDDEGYYLHPTQSEQGDRVTSMELLTENIIAGDDSICSAAGSLSTCVVAVGDGAKMSPGDTVYVSDRIGIVSRGYRRISSISGDTITVTKNFASAPQNLDVCRYSNTSNVLFKNGRHANGSMAINNPAGVSTGIRGKYRQ